MTTLVDCYDSYGKSETQTWSGVLLQNTGYVFTKFATALIMTASAKSGIVREIDRMIALGFATYNITIIEWDKRAYNKIKRVLRKMYPPELRPKVVRGNMNKKLIGEYDFIEYDIFTNWKERRTPLKELLQCEYLPLMMEVVFPARKQGKRYFERTRRSLKRLVKQYGDNYEVHGKTYKGLGSTKKDKRGASMMQFTLIHKDLSK